MEQSAITSIFHHLNEHHNKRDQYIAWIEILHTLGFNETVDAKTTKARDLLYKITFFEVIDVILTAFIFIDIL